MAAKNNVCPGFWETEGCILPCYALYLQKINYTSITHKNLSVLKTLKTLCTKPSARLICSPQKTLMIFGGFLKILKSCHAFLFRDPTSLKNSNAIQAIFEDLVSQQWVCDGGLWNPIL